MRIVLNLFILIGFLGCNKTDRINLRDVEGFTFGRFYGECFGDRCVQVYKLTDVGVYKDISPTYPNRTDLYQGDFRIMDDRFLSEIADLDNLFPQELLNEKNKVFGCPDCGDQGGLYFDVTMKNGDSYFWLFDNWKDANPAYTFDLIDAINESIESLQ